MAPINRTKKFLGINLIIICIYELWCYFNKYSADTISAAIWDQTISHPLFATGTGMIVGGLLVHFFNFEKTKDPS